ncbi:MULTISPECIES: MFS transporter [Streptomyces]|uniref:MFS transporter n=1 Tax=Streptomyces TaxID=1883 RepID=UPI00099C830F|nr:MFS transporter [Streptomyces durhamensis]
MAGTKPVSGARAPSRRPTVRAVAAGSVGNLVEWYEFGVYGFLATVLAERFFAPAGGGSAEALVRTYASFALAFFFRPLGAVLFGRLGDRWGRRPVLIAVVALMSGTTTLIGVLPTYATAGALAPWLLTLLRAVQGLAAGGEFGGAVTVLTEFAPPRRRGLYGAWQSFTVALGLLCGAGVAALTATALTGSQLASWGWRLPFLLALPLGLVALWLRAGLTETPSFLAHAGAPGARTARLGSGALLLAAARVTGWSAAGYTFLVVLPSYLQVSLHADVRRALLSAAVANAGFAAAILPAGLLSDRVGRRPVLFAGAVLVTVTALPLLDVLQDPAASGVAKGGALAAAGAVVGLMAGPGPALLAETFPTGVRWTGLGLAYALANAVFSGCAGLIITEAVRRTGNPDVPAYYAAAACAVSALALLARPTGDTGPTDDARSAENGSGEGGDRCW